MPEEKTGETPENPKGNENELNPIPNSTIEEETVKEKQETANKIKKQPLEPKKPPKKRIKWAKWDWNTTNKINAISTVFTILLFGLYAWLVWQSHEQFRISYTSSLAMLTCRIDSAIFKIGKKVKIIYREVVLGDQPIKITSVRQRFDFDISVAKYSLKEIEDAVIKGDINIYTNRDYPSNHEIDLVSPMTKKDSINCNLGIDQFFVELEYTNSTTDEKYKFYTEFNLMPLTNPRRIRYNDNCPRD